MSARSRGIEEKQDKKFAYAEQGSGENKSFGFNIQIEQEPDSKKPNKKKLGGLERRVKTGGRNIYLPPSQADDKNIGSSSNQTKPAKTQIAEDEKISNTATTGPQKLKLDEMVKYLVHEVKLAKGDIKDIKTIMMQQSDLKEVETKNIEASLSNLTTIYEQKLRVVYSGILDKLKPLESKITAMEQRINMQDIAMVNKIQQYVESMPKPQNSQASSEHAETQSKEHKSQMEVMERSLVSQAQLFNELASLYKNRDREVFQHRQEVDALLDAINADQQDVQELAHRLSRLEGAVYNLPHFPTTKLEDGEATIQSEFNPAVHNKSKTENQGEGNTWINRDVLKAPAFTPSFSKQDGKPHPDAHKQKPNHMATPCTETSVPHQHQFASRSKPKSDDARMCQARGRKAQSAYAPRQIPYPYHAGYFEEAQSVGINEQRYGRMPQQYVGTYPSPQMVYPNITGPRPQNIMDAAGHPYFNRPPPMMINQQVSGGMAHHLQPSHPGPRGTVSGTITQPLDAALMTGPPAEASWPAEAAKPYIVEPVSLEKVTRLMHMSIDNVAKEARLSAGPQNKASFSKQGIGEASSFNSCNNQANQPTADHFTGSIGIGKAPESKYSLNMSDKCQTSDVSSSANNERDQVNKDPPKGVETFRNHPSQNARRSLVSVSRDSTPSEMNITPPIESASCTDNAAPIDSTQSGFNLQPRVLCHGKLVDAIQHNGAVQPECKVVNTRVPDKVVSVKPMLNTTATDASMSATKDKLNQAQNSHKKRGQAADNIMVTTDRRTQEQSLKQKAPPKCNEKLSSKGCSSSIAEDLLSATPLQGSRTVIPSGKEVKPETTQNSVVEGALDMGLSSSQSHQPTSPTVIRPTAVSPFLISNQETAQGPNGRKVSMPPRSRLVNQKAINHLLSVSHNKR